MRYQIFALIIVLKLFASGLSSQSESGDLLAYITNLINEAPHNSSDDYQIPSVQDIENWNIALDLIFENKLTAGREMAANFQYQITAFSDDTQTQTQEYYILERFKDSENYWCIYVFNRFPDRDQLVIQAPHSQFDTNTGLEATFCFQYTNARALFINGTHR